MKQSTSSKFALVTQSFSYSLCNSLKSFLSSKNCWWTLKYALVDFSCKRFPRVRDGKEWRFETVRTRSPSIYENLADAILFDAMFALAGICHGVSDTDPTFRQCLVSIRTPIIFDGRLLNYVKACFCLSLNITTIHKCRIIVIRNIDLRPWSNMILKHVKSNNTPEVLSSFKDLQVVLENITWSRLPLGTERLKTAAILAMFRPFHKEIDIHCLSLCVHLFRISSFYVNSGWWHRFEIFRIRL